MFQGVEGLMPSLIFDLGSSDILKTGKESFFFQLTGISLCYIIKVSHPEKLKITGEKK